MAHGLNASSAFGFVRSQQENRPFWQNQHWPQLISKGTTTRSSILRLVTSEELDHLAHIFITEDNLHFASLADTRRANEDRNRR
jgi:hypothetical protein